MDRAGNKKTLECRPVSWHATEQIDYLVLLLLGRIVVDVADCSKVALVQPDSNLFVHRPERQGGQATPRKARKL